MLISETYEYQVGWTFAAVVAAGFLFWILFFRLPVVHARWVKQFVVRVLKIERVVHTPEQQAKIDAAKRAFEAKWGPFWFWFPVVNIAIYVAAIFCAEGIVWILKQLIWF